MACNCNLSTRSKMKVLNLIDLSSDQTILQYRCLGSVYYDFRTLLFTIIELIMFMLLIISTYNASNS